MTTTLIRGGRLIDPSQDIDRVGHLLLRDDRIVGIDPGTTVADNVIDATGMIVCPGLIDIHVALREPGNEEDETTATGTAAALAGGFTSIACFPDTNPSIDNRGAAEFVFLLAARAKNCNVFPLGAATKRNAGEELAEIGQLVEGGAVALTDGKRPIANAEIMWRVLEYARMFNCPIFNSPQVPELVKDGVMHEGYYSMLLGLPGIPAAAESIMVSRDIALAARTEGRLHLMCVSTTVSVDLIRRARERGVQVSCDVTPHHLALTDAELQSFESCFKVDPPLRPKDHIQSLIEGLKDGTIDIISSDHQPYAIEKKDRELDLVPFGIVGLETLLPICIQTLVEPGHLSWPQLISKLTTGPAALLGIQKGTLKAGADADVTIIDPDIEWQIDPTKFKSRSRNTPFGGRKVKGRAKTVFVSGEIRHAAE
ncbi:MAG: dihydroorotase [Planctomycetota bacterium]|nr:dihydroorotase [Planctomycetota bacterium]MDA1249277.1 dihydroorotase [Planctomycetota bacterium]